MRINRFDQSDYGIWQQVHCSSKPVVTMPFYENSKIIWFYLRYTARRCSGSSALWNDFESSYSFNSWFKPWNSPFCCLHVRIGWTQNLFLPFHGVFYWGRLCVNMLHNFGSEKIWISRCFATFSVIKIEASTKNVDSGHLEVAFSVSLLFKPLINDYWSLINGDDSLHINDNETELTAIVSQWC